MAFGKLFFWPVVVVKAVPINIDTATCVIKNCIITIFKDYPTILNYIDYSDFDSTHYVIGDRSEKLIWVLIDLRPVLIGHIFPIAYFTNHHFMGMVNAKITPSGFL